MALMNPVQVTLAPGSNTVLHGVDGSNPQNIMVIPLAPLSALDGVRMGGQPTSDSVVLINDRAVATTVNLLFFVPHSIVGVNYTDDYA